MTEPECIITGCDIVANNERKWAHGDLHAVGDCYVFNATLENDGSTAWNYSTPPTLTSGRRAAITDSNFIFERRGVIVVPKDAVILNDAAKRYLSL